MAMKQIYLLICAFLETGSNAKGNAKLGSFLIICSGTKGREYTCERWKVSLETSRDANSHNQVSY